MSAQQTVQKLLELQELITHIEQCQKDRAALQRDIEEQEKKVADLENKLEELQNQKQQAQKDADAFEVKIESAEEENERLKIQLNTTKRQSDYDAIRNKMMSNVADMSRWEDEEIELLEKIEDLQGKREDTEKKLAEKEQKLYEIKQRVSQKQAEYDRELKDLQEQEEKMREEIAPEALNTYDRLAKSRGTTAVVRATKRICQGCFTSLPKQTENELMRENELVFCHNCGRILVLDANSSTQTD
ncbi:MAG: hypothetical protein KGZ25_16135 [Planctomycetes bacterium]|nr:hypothetical protein [Planctomycetota bacterium]